VDSTAAALATLHITEALPTRVSQQQKTLYLPPGYSHNGLLSKAYRGSALRLPLSSLPGTSMNMDIHMQSPSARTFPHARPAWSVWLGTTRGCSFRGS